MRITGGSNFAESFVEVEPVEIRGGTRKLHDPWSRVIPVIWGVYGLNVIGSHCRCNHCSLIYGKIRCVIKGVANCVNLSCALVASLVLDADLDEVGVLEDCTRLITRCLRVDGISCEDAVGFGDRVPTGDVVTFGVGIFFVPIAVVTISDTERIGIGGVAGSDVKHVDRSGSRFYRSR